MLTILYSDGQQSSTHCNISCERSEIIINQQPSFTGQDPITHAPYHFFYTDNGIRAPREGDYYWASMLAYMTHEIGHWFGFGHSNESGVDGKACYHGGSIMEAGSIGRWDYDRDLTNEDVCMFMKAYCCARTTNAVEEMPNELKGLSFIVIPNPARTTITLQANRPLTGDGARVHVLDMNGAVGKC